MTAQYWTKTGYDMWMLGPLTDIRLKNLTTGEEIPVVIKIPEGFHAVMMPAIDKKHKNKAPKKRKTKKKRPACLKKYKTRAKNKSKYQGVKPTAKGKFVATYWNPKTKNCKNLGVFDNEIYAAAQVMQALGRFQEYDALMDEYNNNLGPEQFPVADKTDKAVVTGGMQTGDFEGA